MSHTTRNRPPARPARAGLWLALALLFGLATSTALASPAPRAHIVRPTYYETSTEGWSMGRIWSHFRTRSGVVQLCALALVAGLYILMRKFDQGPTEGA